jgi:hypothetical protein
MPQRALSPHEAASALLTEGRRDRRAVSERAWAQFEHHRAEQGDESPAANYWLDVFRVINDRLEQPPVEDAPEPPRKRFDALGRVTTDPPAQVHLSRE